MPMRRSHAKSRLGCNQCKVRRVKCDELLPACTRCIKRGESCSFLTSPAEHDSPNSHSTSNGTPHDCVAEQHTRQLLELELMHHWTTSTYKTMDYARPDSDRVMTIDLPRSALKHDFLLDGIFSLTALHMAHQCQADPHTSDYYVAAAMSFRERGMQRAAPAIQEFHQPGYEPNESEVFAMFWFSALAGMVTMAATVLTRREPSNFATPDPTTGRAFIHMQVEIAFLWRGTRAILEAASTIRASVYAGGDPLMTQQGVDLDPETEAVLSQLDIFMTKPVSTPGEVKNEDDHTPLYRQSAQLIRRSFQAWTHNKSVEHAMAWSPTLGNDFAMLLREGAPRALLSTLCYGTLLDKVSSRWWAGDSGRELVHECSVALKGCPDEWQSLIQWARNNVGLPEHSPATSGPSDPPSVG